MPFVCSNALKLANDQVAIALTFGAFGRHVGLVFKSNDILRVVHMRFHMNVGVEPFPTEHSPCWIAAPLNMHSISSKILIGHLNRIGGASPKIPFGVNVRHSKGSFTPQGDYVRPAGSDGLTCATFVNEICRAIGLPLVDETTWTEDREDDRLWVDEVAGLLQAKKADAAHITWVRGLANGVRIRPEEVAVSGNHKMSAKGIDFLTACASSESLLNTLAGSCVDAAPSLNAIVKAVRKQVNPLPPATLH